MKTTDVELPLDRPRAAIAPWWHTLLVLALLGGASVAGAYQQGFPNLNLPHLSHRLSGYFTVLLEEWLGVLLVWLPLRRAGLSLGSLILGRWESARAFFKDLGLAVAFTLVVVPVDSGFFYLLKAANNQALITMAPHTVSELAVWLLLALSAGFAEELVFRGYLTRQFSAWTGRNWLGLLLQGVAFGLAHGYYGKAMVIIMLHGYFLGLFASWRKSLRPGMLAHGMQDSLGGIAAFFS